MKVVICVIYEKHILVWKRLLDGYFSYTNVYGVADVYSIDLYMQKTGLVKKIGILFSPIIVWSFHSNEHGQDPIFYEQWLTAINIYSFIFCGV